MANTHLNISMIANEMLRRFKNNLVFTKGANRQYSDEFAKKGAKIGNVINIRMPHQFDVSDGAALDLQNTTDKTVALTLDKRKHVAFQFSSSELALNIDEFARRYLDAASEALANQVDVDGLTLAQTSVYNSVGTPGTPPANAAAALKLALQAGQKLDEFACPTGKRTILLNPGAQVEFVSGLSSLFHSGKELEKQYEKGMMGTAAGFNWKMSQNIKMHTVGPLGGTPAVKTTITAEGATQVATDGWTAAAANRLKAGDVFTMAGVYALNPITKQSTGSLMQFVVTEDFDSDVSGEGTVKFEPAIYSEGPYRNVSKLPEGGDAILVFGHASSYANKTSAVNIAYHEDAFVLGTADLDLPGGVDMAARATDPESGLTIRIIRQYDINTDLWPCRADILYGWKAVMPQRACRIHI